MSNRSGACSTRSARGPSIPRVGDPEPGRVGDDAHLGRDLGAVGERRDHLGPLAVRLGEPPLRLRRPLVVEQALDVAGQDRSEAEEPDLVDEVHDHRRLVAGHVGQDDAGGIGPGLEDRPQARVQLGVDEDQVLAGVDGADRDAARRTRPRPVASTMTSMPGGVGQERRIVGDHRAVAAGSRRRARPTEPTWPGSIDAGLAVGALGLARPSGWRWRRARCPGVRRMIRAANPRPA